MIEQWQELKETIIEMRDNDGTGTQQEVCKFLANYMEILEKQMQEPKTGEWIPVSERLPLYSDTYLVTVERMVGTPRVDIKSFAKNLYLVDEFDFHNRKGKSGWYDYDSEYGYWEDTKVIAWMPLPEPYSADVRGAE